MELSQIRYFIAVSETLNFTRAAERCFISQPALTKGIRKLEDALGGELLHRTRNTVELSQLGRLLLPNLKQIYLNAKQTREEAERLVRNNNAVVRIGVMTTLPFDALLPLLNHYQLQQNHIEFRYFDGDFDTLADKLNHKLLDLALLSMPPENGARTPRLTGRFFFSEPYVVVHAATHPFAGLQEIELRQLEDVQYCTRSACEHFPYIAHTLDHCGIHLNQVQQAASESCIENLVRLGQGVTFMPLSQARRAQLDYVQLSGYRFKRNIHIVESPAAAGTAVSELVAYLLEQAKPPQWLA